MPDNASGRRLPTSKDRAESERFEVPGYNGLIAALLDIIRFGPAVLGVPRTLVLLFIAERTVAYRKLADSPSLTQLVEGVYIKRGSAVNWVRRGCGLKRSSAAEAIASLVEVGLLRKQKRSDAKKGNLPTRYEIRWDALRSYLTEKSDTNVSPLVRSADKGSSKPLQTRLSHTPLSAPWISPCPPAGQEQYLDNHSAAISDLNSTSWVDHHHQQKMKLECALASLAVGKTSLNRTEAQTEANGTVGASSLSGSRKADDDEKPAQKPAAPVPPRTEFLLRMAQRHPEIDAPACFADVQGELRMASIPVIAFLRRDLLTTTNPKALTNPRGYYRGLAKTMVAEHQKQMAGIPTEAVVETPRCAKCNGCGYLVERIEGQRPLPTGEFCACQLGQDLAALERRAAKRAAAAVERKPPGQAPDLNVSPAAEGLR